MKTIRCSLLTFLATLICAGCLQARAETYWATIGEGYTSAEMSSGIKAWPRAFSAPDFEKICSLGDKVSQLIARDQEIQVNVGDAFSYEQLKVVALDARGNILEPIPISIGMDDPDEIAPKRSDQDQILFMRPGHLQIRVYVICGGSVPDSPCIIINYHVNDR